MSASASAVSNAIRLARAPRGAIEASAAPRRLRLGLLGCGRVGEAIVRRVRDEGAALRTAGLDIEIVAALVRDVAKRRPAGLPPLVDRAADLFGSAPDLIVEVIGGLEPAGSIVAEALARRIPVVTANKTLVAERGGELRALARASGASFACDAAVVAGVPCLGALSRRPSLQTPRAVTGILNGTSHYILHAVARGSTFASAVDEARARGFAEPDATADISGQDAASKLAIVLQLAGLADVTRLDFPTLGIDVIDSAHVRAARALGGSVKPLALAVLEPGRAGSWVGPAFVADSHAAACSSTVFNFLELHYGGTIPVTFAGPGAGPAITAATVLDDVAEIATGHFTAYSGARPLIRAEDLRAAPPGAWFVHADGHVTTAALSELLALYHVPPVRVVRDGESVAALTAAGEWPHVLNVAEVLRANGARVLTVPAIGGRDDY